MRLQFYLSLLFVGCLLACQPVDGPDFNTQVRPILNQHCLPCHGGVKQSGGVSFLFREFALGKGDSGLPTIVPGKPGQSEMIARLTSKHAAKRMPLDKAPLSEAEIDILTQWVADGAKWELPWSYQPIRGGGNCASVASSNPPCCLNEKDIAPVQSKPEKWSTVIDHFLFLKIQEAGLRPKAPEAPARLIRRLSLDLIGLPPPKHLVQAYLADPNQAVYQSIIDSLLASPHFGERWAAPWLDLARYADTKGYERDGHRDIWRYRDWVIDAFNTDLPYDSFCIQQLAGDLLPTPDAGDLIATAFHRNTMTNDEGGTDNEEFRIQTVMDRVNTSWTVFLGTTMNCVQCHSHPYDPIKMEDYYSSFALFNNDQDEDTHHDAPLLNIFPAPDSSNLRAIEQFIVSKTAKVEERRLSLQATRDLLRITAPQYHPHDFELLENAAHADAKWLRLRPDGWAKLSQVNLQGKSLLFTANGRSVDGGLVDIHLGSKTGPIIASIKGGPSYHWKHQMTPLASVNSEESEQADLYFHFRPAANNHAADFLFTWFTFLDAPFPGQAADWVNWGQQVVDIYNSPNKETLPILQANNADQSRISRHFIRGNWLVPGDTIYPGLPASLQRSDSLVIDDRLDFSNWLTHPSNPLTARVAVNRFWEQLFGTGLVLTSEDFGSQGSPPSHPELLDYLACSFMHEDQWSVKSLLRRMVSSAAYRQSARSDSLDLALDPYNRLLARGPRNRLSAEQVRDQALELAGLLDKTLYGPSVMPPQPTGIWQLVYNGARWRSTPSEQYRRALYTYWRRTSPYPSMETFDSPSREVCVVRRIPTNTPLQALVTLNDPVYLEAARSLALQQLPHLQAQGLTSVLDHLYRDVLARAIKPKEREQLQTLFDAALTDFKTDPSSAAALLDIEHAEALINIRMADLPDLAALMTITNVLLNLDELLTK